MHREEGPGSGPLTRRGKGRRVRHHTRGRGVDRGDDLTGRDHGLCEECPDGDPALGVEKQAVVHVRVPEDPREASWVVTDGVDEAAREGVRDRALAKGRWPRAGGQGPVAKGRWPRAPITAGFKSGKAEEREKH